MLSPYKENEGVKHLWNTSSHVTQAKQHCKIPLGAALHSQSSRLVPEVLATKRIGMALAGSHKSSEDRRRDKMPFPCFPVHRVLFWDAKIKYFMAQKLQ